MKSNSLQFSAPIQVGVLRNVQNPISMQAILPPADYSGSGNPQIMPGVGAAKKIFRVMSQKYC